MNPELTALWITFKLAGITTLILLVLGTPLAWWLARTEARCKTLVEAVVALPLVLPPTVLGFYLLVALGHQGPLGRLMALLGRPPLTFTFAGLVLGALALKSRSIWPGVLCHCIVAFSADFFSLWRSGRLMELL